MTAGRSERGLPPDDARDSYALWDAAYVLGSLSSRERAEFECHLEGCDSCRSAVSELSGMPALLALVDRSEMAGDDAAPPDLPQPRILESLLTTVRRRRRRTRWRAVAVGTVAAVVLGVAVFVSMGVIEAPSDPVPQAAGPMLEMSAMTPSELSATVALAERGWGTEIDMTCSYRDEGPEADEESEAGDNLAMVAVGRDGNPTEIATWTALPGVTAHPSGTTSLPIDDITSIQVVSADTGEVLLQRNL
jgi:hypothetical protein